MKKRGFTLIEIILALGIFTYVFSGIMLLFFQFSRTMHPEKTCSHFTFVIIQNALTESNSLLVSTSSIVLDDLHILSENSSLYIYRLKDSLRFQENKTEFQIDNCNVHFAQSDALPALLFKKEKCVDIVDSHEKINTVCGLK
jgi:prepilin-type N-terminal cleavage/methylation domain-containing protein